MSNTTAQTEARTAYSAEYIEANRLQYNDVDEQNDGDGVGYWYVEIDRVRNTEGATCACGCGHAVSNAKRNFLPGHDQRLMGILVRAHREGMEVCWMSGSMMISTDAMGYGQTVLNDKGVAKLEGYIATEPKRARKGKRTSAAQAAAVLTAPAYTETEIKVGRWVYPARNMADGTQVRNTKRDGSGEWIAV